MAVSLARAGLAGLAGAAVSALAQFLLVVVVTRTGSQEQAGRFLATIALALTVAGICRLDAGNGLIFFISRAEACGYRGVSAYVRAALTPAVLLAGGVGALCAPVLGPLALAIPVMVCADILLAATRGFGSMRPTVLYDGLLLPLAQLLLVAAVAWTATAALLPLAWGAPYALVLLAAAASLRGRAPRAPYPPGAGRDLWRHTGPRALAGAAQAVFQRFDLLLVAALGGPAQAAVYAAATRFKVVGQLANQGLTQAAQPRLIRALAAGDLARARELYQTTTGWLVLLTWPVWLAYATAAPWLLRIFGLEYGSAAPIALVLSATMMVATACGMVDVVLTAAGQTTTSLLNLLCALGVTILLDLALIPAYGGLGAALGWSGGVLVKNLLPLWQLHQRYGLRPFGRHTLRVRAWALP